MVSHPENGSDSPIGSNRDRGRDTFSCHHFIFGSGLPFLAALHVATSVLSCDHIYVSTAFPQVVTFFFRLQPPFLSFALIFLEYMSRPQ